MRRCGTDFSFGGKWKECEFACESELYCKRLRGAGRGSFSDCLYEEGGEGTE